MPSAAQRPSSKSVGPMSGIPVHRETISAISSTLAMMGYQTDAKAGLSTAEEKLKAL